MPRGISVFKEFCGPVTRFERPLLLLTIVVLQIGLIGGIQLRQESQSQMDAYGRQEPARKNGTESEGAGVAVVPDKSCTVCRCRPTVCSLGNVGRRCRVGTKGRQCRRTEVSDLGDSVIRQFVGHSSRDGLLAAVAIFVGEGAGNDMGQACQLFAEIVCLSLLPFAPRLGSFGGRVKSDCATSYYGVNG